MKTRGKKKKSQNTTVCVRCSSCKDHVVNDLHTSWCRLKKFDSDGDCKIKLCKNACVSFDFTNQKEKLIFKIFQDSFNVVLECCALFFAKSLKAGKIFKEEENKSKKHY